MMPWCQIPTRWKFLIPLKVFPIPTMSNTVHPYMMQGNTKAFHMKWLGTTIFTTTQLSNTLWCGNVNTFGFHHRLHSAKKQPVIMSHDQRSHWMQISSEKPSHSDLQVTKIAGQDNQCINWEAITFGNHSGAAQHHQFFTPIDLTLSMSRIVRARVLMTVACDE